MTIFDKLLSDGDENMTVDGADGYMAKINTPISSSKAEIINSSVTHMSQDKSMYISKKCNTHIIFYYWNKNK